MLKYLLGLIGYEIKRKPKGNKLFDQLKDAYEHGGIEAAKEVCRNTRGKAAFVAYKIFDEIVSKRENS